MALKRIIQKYSDVNCDCMVLNGCLLNEKILRISWQSKPDDK
jgi:hypothetical protein